MTIHLPRGFQFAGITCGIKKSGAKDLCLILSEQPAVAAGVYTQNQVVAAPVVLCQKRTPFAFARVVVVNSGNANACTGKRGDEDAARMCQLAAEACQEACGSEVKSDSALVMSTGVIGHLLPMEKIENGIRQAAQQLAGGDTAFLNAADAIMTTDAARKVTTRECQIDGRTVRIAGMAKGAGMIGPNMATMLCCVLTDAALAPEQAQRLLNDAANQSFNNISVEGHTSTNDTMLLLANAAAGGEMLSPIAEVEFAGHLQAMCIELAKQIPADGEGAKHLIEVRIRGAATESDARKLAHSVASSNLVKTAVHGGDPNWGRIVSAAGYAGPPIQPQRLSLTVNGIPLFADGEPLVFDAKLASQAIRQQFTTELDLVVGDGPGECTHWTSDLGVAYVQFNSEYTT